MTDFKAFLSANKLTQSESAEYFGVTQSFISQLVNGKRPIPDYFIEKVESDEAVKGVEYLFSGNINEVADNISKYNISTHNNISEYYTPLLPVSAVGGSLSGFFSQVDSIDHETIISPIKGVDFAITVTGNSMFPEYPSGSKVLIKKIYERIFIEWGHTYVLDTVNGTVIKNLFPAKDENGDVVDNRVVCKSINPDFPDFEIDLNEQTVFGMYKVLLCLALK